MRHVGKVGTGRRRRQPLDVDIVFDGNRHAVERPPARPFRLQRSRLRQRLAFVAQGDEYGRIVMSADAREAARDGLLWRCRPCGMRGENRGERFSHGGQP